MPRLRSCAGDLGAVKENTGRRVGRVGPLRARGGKLYIDSRQNGHGQTIAAPFSLRPLLGAPASCPLAWSEVTARLNPARFTMATVPKRFDKMPGPLVPVLTGEIAQARGLHAAGTACATAQVSTLRERVLKVGVWIERSVRRIVLHFPASFPWQPTWRQIACAVGARP